MATDPTSKLTDQQSAFCAEYLRTGNAAGAYQKVYGCSTKAAESGASRMLRIAKVQAWLAHLRTETSTAAAITLERTLEEIGAVAFANITDAMSWGQKGLTLKDSEQLPPEVAKAIASVEVAPTADGHRRKVTMHPKMAALAMLAKYFGLDDDFNSARQCLKRYGLALVEDPESPAGWSIKPYES